MYRLHSLFYNTLLSKSHQSHSVSNSDLMPSLWLAQSIWPCQVLAAAEAFPGGLPRAMASGIVAIKKLESYLQAYMVAAGVKASRRASLHSLNAPHYSDPVLFSLTWYVRQDYVLIVLQIHSINSFSLDW